MDLYQWQLVDSCLGISSQIHLRHTCRVFRQHLKAIDYGPLKQQFRRLSQKEKIEFCLKHHFNDLVCLVMRTPEKLYGRLNTRPDVVSFGWVEHKVDYQYLLNRACFHGNLEMAHMAVSKIPNNVCRWGDGLKFAVIGGDSLNHRWLAELMISANKRLNHDFNCLLCDACRLGHINMVRLMINHGATDYENGLKAVCLGGDTPGHIEIATLMVTLGAKNWIEGYPHGLEHPRMAELMISMGWKQ
jgi:hypothetical protein